MLLARFFKDRSANIAPIFAIAIIPVIGFVGSAVDYSRANSVKASLQAAVDAAGLSLSKDAQTLTAEQLGLKAKDYVTAQFNRPDAKSLVVTPVLQTPQSGSFVLQITATASFDTSFTPVIGMSSIDLRAYTEVKWGMKRIELALALDNTGSMSSSSKMTELKKAAKSLLATLQAAAKKPDDVRVAIVPFDKTVNIGTGYKDNDWFDIEGVDCNGWDPGTGCTSATWKNYWEGCVRDRTYPYDTQDDPPNSGTPATLYPVFSCGSLVTLKPLTNDWTALNAKVDSMYPAGNTNVTIGLVWAWHALTAGAPLSEAQASQPDLDKVIILLTDGENTEAWKNSNNTKVTYSPSIDLRTQLACTNVKAAGIKLYTVRVINGDAALLKSCATNTSMYYDVQNASQLNAVFSSIAQNLANLRISK